MRRLVILAFATALAGCNDNAPQAADATQAGGSPVTAGGTLPAPPPAGAAPDTRFPLAYPRLTAATYAVGQDVEIVYEGKWAPAKVSEIQMVDNQQMIRTTYPGQTGNLPHLIHSNTDEIRLPTGRLGQDLRVGRYSCWDGKQRPDLNFRVAQYGQYTDPYGEHAGTFTTASETITFRGGKFDGLTAQQLANNRFYFTPQAWCSWEIEW